MFIQSKRPKITGVVCFTMLYLIGFITYSILHQEYLQLVYIGVQVVLTLLLYIAHRQMHYSLSLLWSLSLWGLAHLAGECIQINTHGKLLGDVGLWGEAFNFNRLVHVYGFATATRVSWQTLCSIIHQRYQRRLIPTTGLLLLCITSSMGYGALNEMIEFATTTWFIPNEAESYADIGWDMMANTLGALIAAAAIKIRSL